MKKGIIMLIAICMGSYSFAQKIGNKDLPVAVMAGFQKQFPKAEHVKWEKENDNYEAEFELNKVEQSVVMNIQGNLIEIEVEISINTLPKEVLEYIQKNYQGQKIKEAAKITDSKGVISYEAEIKGMDLLFNTNGKFIKEIKD
jgi:hypothetical protein